MKRLTKTIKIYELIATLFDLIYVVVGGYGLYALFVLLTEPADILTVRYTDFFYYEIFGLTFTSAQVNTTISLLIGFLLVFVPITFKNFRRLRSKDDIELDEWNYRTQFLYMVMNIATFNPIAAVFRFLAAVEIMDVVREYRFKQALINTGQGLVRLIKGTPKGLKKAWHALKSGLERIGQVIAHYPKRVKETLAYQKLRRKAKNDPSLKAEADALKKARDEASIERKKQKRERQDEMERTGLSALIRKTIGLSFNYTFLTFIALFIFIPFYWMILTALKTNQDLTNALTPRIFINLGEMQWVNFKIALTRFNFGQYIGNTLFVGIMSMFGTVITTILAAFAFSRLNFKGRDFLFSVLLMTMMIPGELYTITNFITVSNLSWINTYYALIFPFMTSVFYIFFLRQSFKQIPDTLYRAAQVDGCGDFKYLRRVMIPIARPTIITISILSAIGAWDAYIWPQLVAPSEDKWLISVALRSTSFTVGVGSDARPVYNLQLAATALVTVPLLIIFFSLKKYILAGVGRSGTKG
ncbi:MAG: carbohydrate ABC transporter permease [Acholeplasmataceae bacterium]|nr:carbohydrate ABC transporter permease [Acholeplasmataceae bacterium]